MISTVTDSCVDEDVDEDVSGVNELNSPITFTKLNKGKFCFGSLTLFGHDRLQQLEGGLVLAEVVGHVAV